MRRQQPGASGPAVAVRRLSPRRLRALLYRYAVAIGTIAIVVLAYRRLPVNPTTVALTFLLVVLGVASRWGLDHRHHHGGRRHAWRSTTSSCRRFAPSPSPIRRTGLRCWRFWPAPSLASRLSERARRETENATRRRKEVERLYFLSQQLLATENVMELLNSIPHFVRDAFGLKAAAMYSAQAQGGLSHRRRSS